METGSRLTVRAYHVTDVAYGEENRVTVDGKLTVCRETAEEILEKEPLIKEIKIRIIRPEEHDQHTNTIMDVIPISTKVLGKVGEGITHRRVCAAHRHRRERPAGLQFRRKRRDPGGEGGLGPGGDAS